MLKGMPVSGIITHMSTVCNFLKDLIVNTENYDIQIAKNLYDIFIDYYSHEDYQKMISADDIIVDYTITEYGTDILYELTISSDFEYRITLSDLIVYILNYDYYVIDHEALGDIDPKIVICNFASN